MCLFDVSLPDKVLIVKEEVGGVSIGVDPYVYVCV